MTEIQNIRRLSDGSIDFVHYSREGRALHGAAVRKSVAGAFRFLTRYFRQFLAVVRDRKAATIAYVPVAAE